MTTPSSPDVPPGSVPPGSDLPAGSDVLPAEAAPRRRGRRTALLAVLAGGAAVAVVGTAYATVSFLSGGGAQPEDVLPSDVIAVAKVDLDPAAGQKVAVYRLTQKFPSLKDDVTSEDDVKDQLLRAVFEDVPDVDYERDIAPWIGDRAAIAAVPGGEEPGVLAAVAYTDRDEADAALERLAAQDPGTSFYAFSDNADYVLLGEDQATVDAAAGTEQVLADVESFSDDVDALDGDQIVSAWADLSALWRSMPEDARAAAGEEGFELGGRVVVGAHAESDAVEVEGRGIDVVAGQRLPSTIGARPGVDLVLGLPESTVAALGVTDLGPGLAQLYDELQQAGVPIDIDGMAAELGLQLPDDLVAVFGQQTAVALFEAQEAAARSRTDDPQRAAEVADALTQLLAGGLFGGSFAEGELAGEGMPDVYVDEGLPEDGFSFEEDSGTAELPPVEPGVDEGTVIDGSRVAQTGEDLGVVVEVLDDGIVVGSSASAVEQMSSDDGGLGGSELFQRAVPDADDAGFVLFVDIQRALELGGGAEALGESAEDVDPLEALGITSVGGEDASFRVRLTVR
ncbi:MAG: DUF3352 domain-containing protein [Actinomycetes bacterium]